MIREEKNRLTRQLIVSSAIAEFGIHSYAEASMNEISKKGNISKGIIYHYFQDKDELYLECVKDCFTSLIGFLSSNEISFQRVEESIEIYLSLRHKFFKENPDFSNIFANALLQPPKHLSAQIREITVELHEFNRDFYEQILDHVELKNDVTREEAVEYFILFQESFNHHFKDKNYNDFGRLFDEHELKLSKLLKLMFYGIIKEDQKK